MNTTDGRASNGTAQREHVARDTNNGSARLIRIQYGIIAAQVTHEFPNTDTRGRSNDNLVASNGEVARHRKTLGIDVDGRTRARGNGSLVYRELRCRVDGGNHGRRPEITRRSNYVTHSQEGRRRCAHGG